MQTTDSGPNGLPCTSSSLDAQETSPNPFEDPQPVRAHPLDLQSTQQRIAHRRHEGTRRRIVNALHFHGDSGLTKRAARLGACCCCPQFRTGGTHKIGVNLARCRDRLCPLCSHRRGHEAATKVLALTNEFDAPRLLTLTLRSSDDPLLSCIFRLFSRFAVLRGMKGWSSRVTGGVWTLEVTRNPNTAQWHAHLHIITDGTFFPQKLLKDLWHEATGDSFIVDVRAIHSRRDAAKYVAGYLAKPADVAAWPAAAIAEYALALHGRRLMQPFGSARKVEIDADDDPAGFDPGTLLCTAHTLQAACTAGHEPALNAREILARIGIDHAIAAGMVPPTSTGTAAPVEDWELELAHSTLRLLQEHWPNVPPLNPEARVTERPVVREVQTMLLAPTPAPPRVAGEAPAAPPHPPEPRSL
jgi:hypothetical protein